jgi:uncharacterized protein
MKKIIVLIFVILLLSGSAFGAYDLPDYQGDIYVQDFAQMLSPATENHIANTARELDDKTSAQISIVTIESLEGSDIEGYANELFRKWGLGGKEANNGLLFLISEEDRRFRIEVGYGLEGAINDAKAGDILRGIEEYFRNGQVDQGVILAFNTLTAEIANEYQLELTGECETFPRSTSSEQEREIPLWAVIIGIIILIAIGIYDPRLLFIILHAISRGGGPGGGSQGGRGGSSGGGGASGRW